MTESTKKFKTAIARLKELGAEISEQEDAYDLQIPQDLDLTEGVEVGFLLAQISEHDYPDGFSPLSDLETKQYKTHKGPSPVLFVDSHPHGLQYRVYKKKPTK